MRVLCCNGNVVCAWYPLIPSKKYILLAKYAKKKFVKILYPHQFNNVGHSLPVLHQLISLLNLASSVRAYTYMYGAYGTSCPVSLINNLCVVMKECHCTFHIIIMCVHFSPVSVCVALLPSCLHCLCTLKFLTFLFYVIEAATTRTRTTTAFMAHTERWLFSQVCHEEVGKREGRRRRRKQRWRTSD